MSKITQEQRARFAQKVQEYKKFIDSLAEKEKMLIEAIGSDQQGSGFKRLTLVDEILNQASYYLLLNTLSLSLLGIKNEDHLGDCKKAVARALTHLENTVTALVDAPFSEYEKKLEAIADYPLESRYKLLCKLGFSIRELEEAYGAGSKWKWFFTDFWGKYAALCKNLLDLKSLTLNMDFSSPHRQVTANHLMLVKQQLLLAADRFRERYEAVSNTREDFRQAILFLSALKRVHMLIGDRNEAEDLKKKITIWSAKLEGDMKKEEEKK